jgi:hypothetical protein
VRLVDGGGGSASSSTSGGGTTGSPSTTGGTTTVETTTGTTSGSTTGPEPCSVWVNEVCSLASCADAAIGSPCALDGGGLGVCYGGICQQIDLHHDPNNCGWYGISCPTGSPCVNGTCLGVDCTDGGGCRSDSVCWDAGCTLVDCAQTADDTYCQFGFCCAGSCIGVDPSNCGGCGTRCPAGSVCAVGNGCVLSVECTSDTSFQTCTTSAGNAGTCCGGSCVELTDPLNCGNCGFVCPIGSTCDPSNENCTPGCTSDLTCPSGYVCPGPNFVGGFCTRASCGPGSDNLFCFDADAGALSLCCGGSCVPSTPDLFSSDPNNCGICGRRCAAGEACAGGGCQPIVPCSTNFDQCYVADGGYGVCCGGECVSLTDSANCHRVCDLACPTGTTCNPDLYGVLCLTDAGDSAGCQVDMDCPSGDRCSGGYCVPPSCDGGRSLCFLGDGGYWFGHCCGGVCTDTSSDSANCEVCGFACPVGSACVGGTCVLADGGELDCVSNPSVTCPAGTLCTPDYFYCLSENCQSAQEGSACAYNTTQIGICCGSSCVDLNQDPQNCGWCGNACPNGCPSGCGEAPTPSCLQSCGAGTICAGTQCVGGSCYFSNSAYCLAEDDTVGVCCQLACAHLDRDAQNCGSCGLTCPAGQTCQNGLCNGLTACGPGHAGSFCDLDAGLSFLCCPGLGCIDTSQDPQNCGACNVACISGQSCTAGSCQ